MHCYRTLVLGLMLGTTLAAHAATFTVTTTADSGAGSLRQAITDANGTPGSSIVFNLPSTDSGFAGGVFTIQPASVLPIITADGTVIDGATQTAFGGDTNAAGPEVVLDGSATLFQSGLDLQAGNCAVRNLVITHWFSGITLEGANAAGNVIEGNYIGVDATGAAAAARDNGVQVTSGAHNNTIGGITPAARNVVAGDGSAVIITGAQTTGNVVLGNYLGIDAAGMVALTAYGNVTITNGAAGNTVGGTAPAERNVLLHGVAIAGSGSDGNLVQGNYIGLDATGGTVLVGSTRPAGDLNGIFIASGAQGNIIGGTAAAPLGGGAGNVIAGYFKGIDIADAGTSNNLISGNYIGTNTAGQAGLGNSYGIIIEAGASVNVVGGTTAPGRNIIVSCSGQGVRITDSATTGNIVQGNYIGVGPDGRAALSNDTGVIVLSGANNVVGGTAAGAGNVIAGNRTDGVFVGSNATGTVVQGNIIGADASGINALPNANCGVQLRDGASGSVIGAAPGATGSMVTAAMNIIAFNGHDGVRIAGSTTTGNTVRGNSIHDHADLGINLQPDGEFDNVVTPNDTGDADGGPNALQNYPVISAVTGSGGTTTVSGTLGSLPNHSFIIDLYRNDTAEESGFGEGQAFVQSVTQSTDAAGNTNFTFSFPTPTGAPVYTATATDAATGSTGEFGPSGAGNIVTNTQDSGPGSLRNALTVANAIAGTTVAFNIPTSDPGFNSGVFTIRPATPLPTITGQGVSIDGATQSAFGGDTNTAGPEIVVDGSLTTGAIGLELSSANCTVANLCLVHWSTGLAIQFENATLNTVRGCYIGLAPDGLTAAANHQGLAVQYGAHGNTIGGTTLDARNIISGNLETGLTVDSAGTDDNVVQGNYVGTDAGGTLAVANVHEGLELSGGASHNLIGGSAPGMRNVISGNGRIGFLLSGTATGGNRILGNIIGANRDGTSALPNDNDGIRVAAEGGNTIGGIAPGEGNIVAFNRDHGISVSGGHGTTMRGNAIFSNGEVGINLQSDNDVHYGGVTLNDDLDGDDGPNGLQNFPVITAYSTDAGVTTLSGVLASQPDRDYVIDCYLVTRPDASGYGQGDRYLASSQVVHTSASGDAAFEVSGNFVGQYFTAIATDLATGDSSEFSQANIGVDITTFTPGIGHAGDTVVIKGVGFSSATQVQFTGAQATNFTIDSATQMTVTVPPGAKTGPISITTPVGTGVSRADFIVMPPPNDDFANAIEMPYDNFNFEGFNNGATREPNEPQHGGPGDHSVWFKWTPSQGGLAGLATTDNEFDTLLAVYSGDSLDNLVQLAANDDIGASHSSELTFTATGGQTYYVAVDSKSNGGQSGEGKFHLVWDLAPRAPANDNFDQAILLGGPGGVRTDSNLGATKETGEPDHAASQGGASIWYQWTAPASGLASFVTSEWFTQGSTFDTVLAVYTGSDVAALTHVADNDDSSGSGSRVDFSAVQGVTYHIAIDGVGDGTTVAQGRTLLVWSMAPASESDIHWTGAGGDGLWSNPANWSLGRLPFPTESASIDAAGTYTVNVDIDAQLDNLTVAAATGRATVQIGAGHELNINHLTVAGTGGISLLADGTLTVHYSQELHGHFDWQGGTLIGLGHTYIDADATVAISGPDAKHLVYQSITSLGTVTWSGSGDIIAGSGASFLNQGTFTVDGDATFDWDQNPLKPAFQNDKGGVFTKTSAAAGTTVFKVSFGNDGQVNVESGNVSLRGGGVSYGHFAVATGSRIEVASDYVFDKQFSDFTGGGSATLTDGTTHVDINLAMNNFVMQAGTLTGDKDLLARNQLVWQGGAMAGNGTTTLADTCTTSITSDAAKTLAQRTLNNQGTVNWDGLAPIAAGDGAVVNNAGNFNCADNATFTAGGGKEFTFNNLAGGQLAGAGIIGGSLDNAGTLDPASLGTGLPAPAPGGSAPGGSRAARQTRTVLVGGLLTINGDLTQHAGARLTIKIGGTTEPGTGKLLYSRVQVNRDVTLDPASALDVQPANNYEFQPDDEFEVLRAKSIAGDFGVQHLPALPTGLVWSVQKQPSGVATFTGYVLQVLSHRPGISGFNPSSGRVGATITITGTNLARDINVKPAVQFNGTAVDAASIAVVDANTITAVVPQGATSGKIAVTTADGTITSGGDFTVLQPAILQFASPTYSVTEGPASVGLAVQRGGGMEGATDINYAVTGGTARGGADYTLAAGTLHFAANQTSQNIVATITNDAVHEAAETVIVTLTLPNGSIDQLGATKTATLTISDNDPLPAITAISPAGAAAGATVTLTGSSLTGATAVKFGATTASFTNQSATQLTAVIPAGMAAGPVGVTVTTPAGTSAPFTYTVALAKPVLTAITPGSGASGLLVKLTGSHLDKVTTAKFGTVGATIGSQNATAINVVVPGGLAAGTVNVMVTSPAGNSNTLPFTVMPAGSPGTLQFSTASYSVNEGAGTASITVTRTGGTTGAVGVTYATGNGTAQQPGDYTTKTGTLSWAAGDSASKTFTVPIINDTAVESAETINLTLSNPTGGASLGAQKTAVLTITDDDAPSGAPTIASFTPTSGKAGTEVTITGTDLGGARSVKFHGVTASPFTVNATGTQIAVAVPAGAITGTITVTTAGGTATSATSFTVPPAPAIATFSPISGVWGTEVTITGSHFTGATIVRFNNKAIASSGFTVVDDAHIKAKVPVGTVTGPLAVTAGAGASPDTGRFTVLAPPVITTFSPISGKVGATITITGSNFTGLRELKFFDNKQPAIVSVTDTQIVAKVPAGATTGPLFIRTGLGQMTTRGNFFVLPGAPARTSGVLLSCAGASAATGTIALQFSGALDTDSAANTAHFTVTINGTLVELAGAAYNPVTHTAMLVCGDGTLRIGDAVLVVCDEIADVNGGMLPVQTSTVVAR